MRVPGATQAISRRPGAILVTTFSVVALLCAIAGARMALRGLDEQRVRFQSDSPAARELAAARSLGFEEAAWTYLRDRVRASDRYAIYTGNPAPFEVRNFAAYWLLPAVRVLDERQADVVVWIDAQAPPGADCYIGQQRVCLARRGSR